jgi:hypothetical protein
MVSNVGCDGCTKARLVLGPATRWRHAYGLRGDMLQAACSHWSAPSRPDSEVNSSRGGMEHTRANKCGGARRRMRDERLRIGQRFSHSRRPNLKIQQQQFLPTLPTPHTHSSSHDNFAYLCHSSWRSGCALAQR